MFSSDEKEIKSIGTGVYGVVYKVKDENGIDIAIKRNRKDKSTSFSASLKELDMLKKINHPNIIRISKIITKSIFNGKGNLKFEQLSDEHSEDIYTDDKIHFGLELGKHDLHTFIYEIKDMEIIEYYKTAHKYMKDILIGIEYLHSQKILHRDLKPSNFIIVDNICKICDFGLSKFYNKSENQTLGIYSSIYRSPEISCGYCKYEYSADMWALGCLFYEMISRETFIDINVIRKEQRDEKDENEKLLSSIIKNLNKFEAEDKNLLYEMTKKQKKYFCSNIKYLDKMKLRNEEVNALKKLGIFDNVLSLIESLLVFNHKKRKNSKECLDSPLFDLYRKEINESRRKYIEVNNYQNLIIKNNIIEEEWCADLIKKLLKNKNELITTKIIFHSLELFNRYLYKYIHNCNPKIETGIQGKYLSKNETRLTFYVCIYIFIKYFNTLIVIPPFDEFFSDISKSESEICEKIEFDIVYKYFEKSLLYVETIYEFMGDYIKNENIISEILTILLYNKNVNLISPSKLFEIYIEKIYKKNLDLINFIF